MKSDFLTIGFIGLGLIGGSIAKAIKQAHPNYRIIATSRSFAPLTAAKEDGVVDIITDCLDNRFASCDFIFVCTPVITIGAYFEQLKTITGANCIITDVGSVKESVHAAAEKAGISDRFIGGHPMAGSELSGYAHSDASLLQNAAYVITVTEDTPDAALFAYRSLVVDIGANPIVMDCRLHDISVAAISHLPHLAAAALALVVKNNDDPKEHMRQLAAGGFRDTTRIAASSPEMWSQICSANGSAICTMIDLYIKQLQEIRSHIAAGSAQCSAKDCGENQPQSLSSDGNTDYIEQLFAESRTYRKTF